jgi:hypothetical protein
MLTMLGNILDIGWLLSDVTAQEGFSARPKRRHFAIIGSRRVWGRSTKSSHVTSQIARGLVSIASSKPE